MAELSIRLFGGLEVSSAEAVLPPLPTQKSQSLLAYLVLEAGRMVHRDVLCGRLWGDHSDTQARKALRTALWRVRKMLKHAVDGGERLLRVDARGIGFTDSVRVWADVWEFESCLGGLRGRPEGADVTARALVRAATLYRGDLLEGTYEDWCVATRERFRLDFLTSLEHLVDHSVARGDWLDAIAWGTRLLHFDPLRELMHRKMMESHLARGDRASALRQYRRCRHALRDELGIEPMEETRSLRDRMLNDGVSDRGSVPDSHDERAARGGGVHAVVDEAIRDLHEILSRLERARSAHELEEVAPAEDGPLEESEAPARRRWELDRARSRGRRRGRSPRATDTG